ncbi:hypothetical protein [Pseudanabaena sp. SR411]|uniref:hypothetical protein n=1 Tax=Pseudanabaena sp. SR411 TaxID=1980935 RepID=UPI000B982711|nr:hypothetical protein [Pseudanabaena sp. SR411]
MEYRLGAIAEMVALSYVGAMSELCFYLRLGCSGRGLAFAAMFSKSRDYLCWQMLNPLCGQLFDA